VKLMGSVGLSGLSRKLPLLKKTALLKSMPQRTKLSDAFKKHLVNRTVFGGEMLQELSKFMIGFNIHAGIAGDYAANIRMFEVTGMGSLLLTDYKKNIQDLFIPDEEIVCYNSVGECVDKTRWLLSNREELHRIAAAGQAKTLRVHSVASRVEQLNELILEDL